MVPNWSSWEDGLLGTDLLNRTLQQTEFQSFVFWLRFCFVWLELFYFVNVVKYPYLSKTRIEFLCPNRLERNLNIVTPLVICGHENMLTVDTTESSVWPEEKSEGSQLTNYTIIIIKNVSVHSLLSVKKHNCVITDVSTHQRKPTRPGPSPLSHDNRLHRCLFHFPSSVSSDFCLRD